jgi:hypothetical protein
MNDAAIRWTRAETYAQEARSTRDEVVARILDGGLNGVVIGTHWYVLDFLVNVERRDRAHPEQGRLVMAARRDGDHYTAGCGRFTLDLSYDHDEIATALHSLMPDLLARMPDAPVAVTLGGQAVRVDASLRGDLAAALVEWQVEVELGSLLEQYRPDDPD